MVCQNNKSWFWLSEWYSLLMAIPYHQAGFESFQQHCKHCHSHVLLFTLQQNKNGKISHVILINRCKSDLIFKFWAKYSLNSFLPPPCLTWDGSIDSFTAFFGYVKVNNTLENSDIYKAVCCQQKQVNQKSYSQFLKLCSFRLYSKWTVMGYAVYSHLLHKKMVQILKEWSRFFSLLKDWILPSTLNASKQGLQYPTNFPKEKIYASNFPTNTAGRNWPWGFQ